jgi:hypothetical protein
MDLDDGSSSSSSSSSSSCDSALRSEAVAVASSDKLASSDNNALQRSALQAMDVDSGTSEKSEEPHLQQDVFAMAVANGCDIGLSEVLFYLLLLLLLL